VQRERIKDFIQPDPNGNIKMTAQYKETLPGGVTHNILEEWGDKGPLDNTGVYRVPNGHYFAMGDNRDNSQDSRVLPEVGYIPKENLVGRAEILFFSTNGRARVWEFWNWPIAVRFARLFKDIK
ncbi:MAG: signal peptidase I, partial [Pseudomonadota bacterium]|nr:signal peptidase I [Pseudomonadota bacterium]